MIEQARLRKALWMSPPRSHGRASAPPASGAFPGRNHVPTAASDDRDDVPSRELVAMLHVVMDTVGEQVAGAAPESMWASDQALG